jgi:ATP phosphoribosyltransferase
MHRIFAGGVFMRVAGNRKFIISDSQDMLTDIAAGLGGFALIGSDKLGELDNEQLAKYEQERIKRLNCIFALVGRSGCKGAFADFRPTVATSYPREFGRFAAENFALFAFRSTRIINGKAERFPASGMTTFAFDIVQSGQTIRENGLEIWREGESIDLCGIWR